MLPDGYQLRQGSVTDHKLLVNFMIQTYQELFPEQKDLSHLADTVKKYFSPDTLLWWVESNKTELRLTPIACIWIGNAIDQVTGERYAHIFLVYVKPEHRYQGIATALLQIAQNWAKARGDRHIGLQVFCNNQPALNLYHRLGFETRSLLMLKPLITDNSSRMR